MVNYETIIVIIIALLSTTLGFIILLNNSRAKANKSFFGLVLFLVLWIISSYLETKSNQSSITRFLIGLDYGSAPFIGFFFVLFAYSFPKERFISKIRIITLLFFALTSSILCFTSLVIKGISGSGDHISVTTGSFYISYTIVTSGYILFALIRLIVEHTKATGIQRKQTSNVLIGFFLTGFLALSTNLFLSRIINPSMYKYGVYSVIFFVSFTAYSIVKHKMLNIKTIATEVTVLVMVLVELIQTLLSKTYKEFGLRFAFLLIVSYIGYLLIKSVQIEIQQKEKLQTLAKKLDEANQHLEELDEAKDNFLSMAAHELNTPIAAIEGYLSMIIDEKMVGDINPKAMGYLNNIYGSSKRLANLVKNLLNVSRIESNRIHLLYAEVQTEDIIDQAIAEVKIKADEVGHKLTFDKPKEKLPKTWFDVDRITEVIINMVGNAIKYTDPPGVINVSAHTDGDKIVVAIKDTGRGIPKDKEDHIFEKFAQVNVLKDQVKGTGLGMFIVKNLVELHKGKVWFTSSTDEKDHGTTFYFSLPILKEKPEDPHEGEGVLFQTGQPKAPVQERTANITDGEKSEDVKAHDQKAAEKLVEIKKDSNNKKPETDSRPEDKTEK